jgi:7-keto-8-aminopelargonate synthetase-like enzyme
MDLHNTDDSVTRRIKGDDDRVSMARKSMTCTFTTSQWRRCSRDESARAWTRDGHVCLLQLSGLVGHPRINEAAKAVDKFGTGTHGVRTLAGTLTIHTELEETIANFKHTEAAITYSSGYATNLTVISTLMGRGDYIFSDKLNHASIVDGCLMSGAEFRRFRHNDMEHLEGLLRNAPPMLPNW